MLQTFWQGFRSTVWWSFVVAVLLGLILNVLDWWGIA